MERRVDGASLAVLRILFGAIVFWEVYRYFTHGWIAAYWLRPTMHFTYLGFGWIRPWPEWGMYAHFAMLGAAAIGVSLGAFYRLSSVVLWLGFTYQFLLEQARYLNHFYAAVLLAFLLAVLPAANVWSIDSVIAKSRRQATVPSWAIFILRFQVGVIYFYAGIAKLNADWLHGEPIASWLRSSVENPTALFIVDHGMAGLVAGGGLAFDLLVVPALIWRRTRLIAFVGACVFHALNSRLFVIGMFPWMMIAATTVFFDPDWPRRVLSWFRSSTVVSPRGVGQELTHASGVTHPLLAIALGGYVLIQCTVPLRHWLYPGDVAWTEEGHRFSWRMMLRDKVGTARFVVVSGAERVDVRLSDYLTSWQSRAMVSRPDMILQFAHYIADDYRRKGRPEVRVYADVIVSLDGHAERRLVDPTVDLASQARTLWPPARWILRYGG